MSAIVVALLTAGLAACGTPDGPPSAQEILAKPNSANLRDAHFVLVGTLTNNGSTVDISGDGQVVYRSAPPAGQFRFHSTVAGRLVVFEDIYINGTDYGLTLPGNGKWTARPAAGGLGPGSFSGASDFKYDGEEDLPLGRAWHAQAKDKGGNAFEAWIRESDGFPLRYQLSATNTKAGTSMTLTFDTYNTGVTIAAPPASQVVQG